MTSAGTRFVFVVAAVAALATAGLAAPGPVGAGSAAQPYDLNGDGRREVVVGVPSWDLAGHRDAGAVLVLPGTRTGVGVRETVLHRPPDGATLASSFDWSTSVASADFDRDGFADLAVGMPFGPTEGETTPAGDFTQGSGSVTIFRGSRSGLSPTPQIRVLHGPHSGFGASLVAADFDSDGWVDLAVGSISDTPRPDADFGSGAVVVLHGGSGGFSLDHSHSVARPDPADAGFGWVLAAGDVNRDGHPDLVEGFAGTDEYTDEPDPPVPGHTSYLAGTAAGPQVARRIGGRAAALAVGDVTGDGYADIVAGNPVRKPFAEDMPVPTGRVTLYRGGAQGPLAAGLTVSQASRGVPGSDERGDRFGAALGLADLDRDGRADVVIGSPGEDRGAGRVTVLRGARSGFARLGSWAFDQASRGVPGRSERGDAFGAAIAMLDVDGNGRRDFVVGAPGENKFAGAVTVLRVQRTSYVAAGARAVTAKGLGQKPGPFARLGSVLGREG